MGESIVFKEMNVVILLVVEKVLKGQKGNIYIYVEGPGGLKCQELCITRECPEKLESLEWMSENIVGLAVNPVGAPSSTVSNRGKFSMVAELAVDVIIITII